MNNNNGYNWTEEEKSLFRNSRTVSASTGLNWIIGLFFIGIGIMIIFLFDAEKNIFTILNPISMIFYLIGGIFITQNSEDEKNESQDELYYKVYGKYPKDKWSNNIAPEDWIEYLKSHPHDKNIICPGIVEATRMKEQGIINPTNNDYKYLSPPTRSTKSLHTKQKTYTQDEVDRMLADREALAYVLGNAAAQDDYDYEQWVNSL